MSRVLVPWARALGLARARATTMNPTIATRTAPVRLPTSCTCFGFCTTSTQHKAGTGAGSITATCTAGADFAGKRNALALTVSAVTAAAITAAALSTSAHAASPGASSGGSAGADDDGGGEEAKKIRTTVERSHVETALACTYDTYGGVIVDAASVASCDCEETFRERLTSSVAAWKADERRGVWLKIPASQTAFLPHALGQGFEMHHCEKDHLMLTLWIPGERGEANTLPGYTSHTVGVGGVVINEANEILVVQERSGPAAGIDFWKYPTGMVEAGEDASQAVVREIKEETGIEAEVVSLVGFREAHTPAGSNWMSGKTNIFMVFLLRPKTTDIVIQEREIAKCEWLPLDKYWESAETRMKPGTLYHSLAALAIDVNDKAASGFENRHLPLGFRPGSDNTYFCTDAAGRVGVEESRVQQNSQRAG